MSEDPFIVVSRRYAWSCYSCGHEGGPRYYTEGEARRAGENHSCLDHIKPDVPLVGAVVEEETPDG